MDIDGVTIRLGDPGSGADLQFLYFLSVTCQPCRRALPRFRTFVEKTSHAVDWIVVCAGTDIEVREFTAGLSAGLPIHIIADPQWRIAEKVSVKSTPYAFVVDSAGIVQVKGMPDTDDNFAWMLGEVDHKTLDREPVQEAI